MQKKGCFLGFPMIIYYLCTMINDNPKTLNQELFISRSRNIVVSHW